MSTSFLPGKAASLARAGHHMCAWLGRVRVVRLGNVECEPRTRVRPMRVRVLHGRLREPVWPIWLGDTIASLLVCNTQVCCGYVVHWVFLVYNGGCP